MLTPRRNASMARGAFCSGDVAVAALLVHPAVSRVMLFQASKEFERVRDTIQIAQVHRRQVQQVTVFGVPGQQWIDARQRRNVVTFSGKFLQAKNLLLQQRRLGGQKFHAGQVDHRRMSSGLIRRCRRGWTSGRGGTPRSSPQIRQEPSERQGHPSPDPRCSRGRSRCGPRSDTRRSGPARP